MPVPESKRAHSATLAVALLLILPTLAQGATFRHGPAAGLPAGETIHDDLYATGGNINIQGTVDGDLVVSGGSILVSGVVNGNLLSAGGSTRITGTVRGTVRATGGQIQASGEVERDFVAAGGDVTLGPGSRVGRDVLVGAGRTALEGTVGRNVRVGAGRIQLAGSAVIGGDLTYSSKRELERGSGAMVRGKIERVTHGTLGPGMRLVHWVRGLMGLLLFGLFLVLPFSGFTRRAVQAMADSPGSSLGIGLLIFIAAPFIVSLVFLLGLLIGGWWIGLLLLVACITVLALGYVVAAMRVGEWGARRMGRSGIHLVWALIMGLFMLGLFTWIPFVGKIVALIAMLFGVGALMQTWFRRLRPGTVPAASARPAVPPIASEGAPA